MPPATAVQSGQGLRALWAFAGAVAFIRGLISTGPALRRQTKVAGELSALDDLSRPAIDVRISKIGVMHKWGQKVVHTERRRGSPQSRSVLE